MYEIIVNNNNEKMEILILENNSLVEIYEEKTNIEGNIYLGKVQNVYVGMESAFVNIGEKKNAFIQLKDVLPKIDEKTEKLDMKKQIKEIIKPGDRIIVQVKRMATNKKGARITTHIKLSGKYVALIPNASFITISQKIDSEEEIKRLKELIRKNLPNGYGAIIRTAAKNKSEEELKKDINNTFNIFKNIESKANVEEKIPRLLYKEDSLLEKTLKYFYNKNISKIYVNNEENKKEIEKILNKLEASIEIVIKDNLLNMYNLTKELDDLNKQKIYLKCGGFIIIEKTEALTTIDVNSGKYMGQKDVVDTILKINEEATIEIVKQLKLRDIRGMIIVDYINMSDENNRKITKELLTELLKKDRSKTQVFGFTKLNLLEMTRKSIG